MAEAASAEHQPGSRGSGAPTSGAASGEVTGPASPSESPRLFAEDGFLAVNPADRIIARYALGSGPKPQHRKIGYGVATQGWKPFVEGRLQRAVDAGIRRISLHMPFGQRTYVVDPATGEASAAEGESLFQFDAYLDARRQVPAVTADFVPELRKFIEENTAGGKLIEANVYIGSPRLDPDQTALVDKPAAWWSRAYEILTPLLDAGFRSISFDASASAEPNTLDYHLHEVLRYPALRDPVRDARLIRATGNEPVRVYLEAVPHRSTGRTDYPLMLLDWAWEKQDPDRPGPHQAALQKRFFEHDQFTGEIVRMVRHEQWKARELAPVEKILLAGHTAAIPDSLILNPGHFGADSMASFLAKLELPSLPTLVDLDPDDVNPETAEYEITVEPRFGALAENPFHADVFTYTPNPNFRGIDSFRYTVQDGSGATASGVVQLSVEGPVASRSPASPFGTSPRIPSGTRRFRR